MLIPFGTLAASGPGAIGTYELIFTTILNSTTAEVVFNVSTFASTYKHLQIRAVSRDDRSGQNASNLRARFNGDSGNNYAIHLLDGNGSGITSFGLGSHNLALMSDTPAINGTANSFGATVTDILDPFSTTKNKTIRTFSGTVGNYNLVALRSAAWFNTAPITSIALSGLGNFVAGSRFSLYGIR